MRVNISVPDDLAAAVRELKLPVSAICQSALRQEVSHRTPSRDEMAELRSAVAEKDAEIGRWRDVVHGNHAEMRRLHELLAERNAEIERLRAGAASVERVP